MTCKYCGGKTMVVDVTEYRGAVYRLRRCKECREPDYTQETSTDPGRVRQALNWKGNQRRKQNEEE